MSNKPAPIKQYTPEERIQMYMKDETGQLTLSAADHELMLQIGFADDQLRRLNTQKDVVTMLMKKFGVGSAKAYQIIAKTQTVYGTSQQAQQNYYRGVIADLIIHDMQHARKHGDTKALVGLYDKLIKVQRLDKDDDKNIPQAPPPAVVMYQYNLQLLGVEPQDNLEQRAMEYLQIKPEEHGE